MNFLTNCNCVTELFSQSRIKELRERYFHIHSFSSAFLQILTMEYPPAIQVAMAISKLASEQQKHRAGFLTVMEVLMRPLQLPDEDLARCFHQLNQAIQQPLIIFHQVILPTSDMPRLRNSFGILRGMPDMTNLTIKDSVRRHEFLRLLKVHNRKLKQSFNEISPYCMLSKRGSELVDNIQPQLFNAQMIASRLREYALVLQGRATEARRGGPFGSKKYHRDLMNKSQMYAYASSRVDDFPAVTNYISAIIKQYCIVIEGIEKWVLGYEERGRGLYKDLKDKDGGKVEALRKKVNLYLEEGRLFRLALERLYFVCYTLKNELSMVPQMIGNDELIREAITQFYQEARMAV